MDLRTKRRVALAQALLADPKVVFLDAPLAGLDHEGKEEIRHLIVALRETTTLCVATDSLDEALTVADRLIVMNAGRVLADGTMADLLATEKTLMRFVLVVKGPKPEELTEVIRKLKPVRETERIPTRKQELAGIEITATAGEGVKEAIKSAVSAAGWELIRIGRKSLDLPEIYARLIGA
jgi:ABC-type multidrug transport system ATPase subunit